MLVFGGLEPSCGSGSTGVLQLVVDLFTASDAFCERRRMTNW